MKQIWRTSALLVGLMMMYKLLGFAEKVVLAAAFGLGAQSDAYVAGSGAILLLGFLITDVIGPALIPVLLAHPSTAPRTLANTATWVLLCTLPLTWLCYRSASGVARLFGPGFDAHTLQLTTQIVRICVLSLPTLALAAVWTGWHHAQQHFVRPAVADLLLKLGPLLGLALLGGLTGLAWGVVVGAGMRALMLGLVRLPLRPRLRFDPHWREVLRAALPLLITAGISLQLMGVVETAIASTLSSGAVTALSYARRIVDVPVMVVPQVVARTIFPSLTQLVLTQQTVRMVQLLHLCVRVTLLALAPLTVMGILLATPIVQLLLQRGAFDPAAVVPTATALAAVMPTLPALALAVLLMRFNYAVGDTWWPSVIRVVGTLLHIGLALWSRRWGLLGLGLASSIVVWLEALALIAVAYRHFKLSLRIDLRFWLVLIGALLATAAMVMSLRHLLPTPQGSLALLLYLSGCSVCGLVVYGLVLSVGQIDEWRTGWRWFRRRLALRQSSAGEP